MKIPLSLPQFTDDPVLIAVVGKKRGVLYSAADGITREVAAVEEPTPQYSDREGFFMRAGKGMLWGAGGPYGDEPEIDRSRFIEEVVEELRSAVRTHGAKRVYLFEPRYLKGAITDVLKKRERVETVLVTYGNFVNEQPIALIERIAAYELPAPDPADPASVKGERHAKEKEKILSVALER